jgi:hypothetical protein
VGTGLWPAFWMLGDNLFSGTNWPNCGEEDLMENVSQLGASTIRSSLNGPGYSAGTSIHTNYVFPSGGRVDTAFHTYGVIWTTNSIQYYVDDYTKPFVAFTPASLPAGGTWAYNGHPFFLLLNLAVGGTWPGNPDGTTPSPANMYVDYVRVYQPGPSPGFYEAEKAAVSGAVVTNYYAGYTGTGYVDYQNATADYVEWAFRSAPYAGTQALQFRYANGAGGSRPLELKVNGAVITTNAFPLTGSWTSWHTVTNYTRLAPGSNTVRLTATRTSGGNLDSLTLGSGAYAPPGLAIRFPFDDGPGTTTTPSETNSGGANLTLLLLNSGRIATDYHGAPGSGVSGLARALDFSSDANGGTANNMLLGALARSASQPNLGFGIVTSFTATVWFKLDSMFTNTLNRGGCVFLVGTNGVVDAGNTNCVSLQFFDPTQLQYKISTNTVGVAFGSRVPTNTWLFYAIVYDGISTRVYGGSEGAPAALVSTTNDLAGPQSINFGTTGTIMLGNRQAMDRAFDGWIQDFRFYTYAAGSNAVEDVRWSAVGPANVTAGMANNQVSLTWSAVAGAASYTVWRSTVNGSGYEVIASGVSGTNYTDPGAVPGATNYYVISAVDAGGSGTKSQNSNATAITLPAPGLAVTLTNTEVALTWPASAAGYKLYGAPSLTPPIVWSLVTNAVTPQGDKSSVLLPMDPAVRFFRLANP